MKRVAYSELQGRRVEINVSPLIDCVFLLLIFFVVTTVFVEETGVQVDKPRAVSAVPLDRRSILLALTPDGRILQGGRELALNRVRGFVARQLAQEQVPVVIIADAAADCGRLVELLDECKRAGAERVSLAADRKEAAGLVGKE